MTTKTVWGVRHVGTGEVIEHPDERSARSAAKSPEFELVFCREVDSGWTSMTSQPVSSAATQATPTGPTRSPDTVGVPKHRVKRTTAKAA